MEETALSKTDSAPQEAQENEASKLIRLATEINTIKEQTRAAVKSATLEIGKRLVEAKAVVPHGGWGYWLQQNVDYSERTAQLIMSVWERFGSGQTKLFGKEPDAALVAKLNRSQLVALMSIKDEEECMTFMEDHKDDLADMSKRELEKAIKERDEAKRGLEKWRQEADLANEAAQNAIDKSDKLRRKLDSLQEDHEAEIEDLRKRLKEAEEAPVDVTPTDESETVKELREKIAALEKERDARTTAEKAFARHFENIKGEYAAMRQEIDCMDEEKAAKYRAAMQKLFSTMADAVAPF